MNGACVVFDALRQELMVSSLVTPAACGQQQDLLLLDHGPSTAVVQPGQARGMSTRRTQENLFVYSIG